jgi:hypothetical protein
MLSPIVATFYPYLDDSKNVGHAQCEKAQQELNLSDPNFHWK